MAACGPIPECRRFPARVPSGNGYSLTNSLLMTNALTINLLKTLEVVSMSQQQLQKIIDMLKAQPISGKPSIAETRAGFEQMAAMFPVEAVVRSEPVNAGGVKSELVSAPNAAPGRAVLYLHGGGYVIGSINTHRSLAGGIFRAAQTRGLGGESRPPPPRKPSRIAVAGDSAGGGLTVATLVAIRDAKLPVPAAGVPLSPWVDMEGLG